MFGPELLLSEWLQIFAAVNHRAALHGPRMRAMTV
jgi:hypothetical protein